MGSDQQEGVADVRRERAGPIGGAVAAPVWAWTADVESTADLEGVDLTEADRRLIEVYGDTVHRNDGRHLHGEADAERDAMHVRWFDRVVSQSHQLYLPPRCAVGK